MVDVENWNGRKERRIDLETATLDHANSGDGSGGHERYGQQRGTSLCAAARESGEGTDEECEKLENGNGAETRGGPSHGCLPAHHASLPNPAPPVAGGGIHSTVTAGSLGFRAGGR